VMPRQKVLQLGLKGWQLRPPPHFWLALHTLGAALPVILLLVQVADCRWK
jgi:hypothetical protein